MFSRHYVDNSNNLTYIYPEYTTINENNETVTNISENPIIYNNETKQYYTYDTVTNNYYYITYEEPKPSATPAPTWTPGGGSTRGGGVGRTPHDTDSADWTLHYYILNNRRYDAYYAQKRTEVDTEKNLPWKDDKHYISTTQIPIANGEYTISVPDGVYWRVWQWDETSQTLVITERFTRQEIVLKVKSKTADSTTKAMQKLKQKFGEDFNKIFFTITLDNGAEFANQQAFDSLGVPAFYCHPGQPYERGSNENNNKLLRRHFPKGQSMKHKTQHHATQAQHFINTYPREMFNGRTSNDLFKEQLEKIDLKNREKIYRFFNIQ